MPHDAVPPEYFEKPLYVVPAKGGVKPYHILRETLRRTGRVAVATIVMRGRQHLAALIADEKVITLELLRFAHEIKAVSELEAGDALDVRPRSRTRRSSSPSSWSRRSTSRGRPSSSATSTATTCSS